MLQILRLAKSQEYLVCYKDYQMLQIRGIPHATVDQAEQCPSSQGGLKGIFQAAILPQQIAFL